MADNKELNEKQKRFCEEYVFDWNATRAYQVAYPDSTYDSARSSSSTALTNPNILEYIEEIQKDFAKLAGISKLSVLKELQKIILEEDSEEVAKRDKIKALEVVNKMLGFNEAEKKDITNTNSILQVQLTKTDTPPITNESDLFDDD